MKQIASPSAAKSASDRTVIVAITFSILVHMLLLAIHFDLPDRIKQAISAPSLEITLVNAKTLERPTKPDALAQANLDGGGNTDANRQLKSPLPRAPTEAPETVMETPQQKVDALEREVQNLMAQLKAAGEPQKVAANTGAVTGKLFNEIKERVMELQRLEAQIAKDLDAYQQRPKKKHIGARTAEYRFARYVEDWRLKIERVGNENYPQEAREKKIYGTMILTVGIRADGSIESVEIDKSSGTRLLDTAALRTVKLAAPYAPFPPDIRADTDILYITRTWSFTRDEGFGTSSKPTP